MRESQHDRLPLRPPRRRSLRPPGLRAPWTLSQPTEPIERIVVVAPSSPLLFCTLQLLPSKDITLLMLGARLRNSALLHVTLRTQVNSDGHVDLPPEQRWSLPLSMLLLVFTVALSLPAHAKAAVGWATPGTARCRNAPA